MEVMEDLSPTSESQWIILHELLEMLVYSIYSSHPAAMPGFGGRERKMWWAWP